MILIHIMDIITYNMSHENIRDVIYKSHNYDTNMILSYILLIHIYISSDIS